MVTKYHKSKQKQPIQNIPLAKFCFVLLMISKTSAIISSGLSTRPSFVGFVSSRCNHSCLSRRTSIGIMGISAIESVVRRGVPSSSLLTMSTDLGISSDKSSGIIESTSEPPTSTSEAESENKILQSKFNGNATSTLTALEIERGRKRRKKKKKDKKEARALRRKFIGKAKAVDNGRYSTVYSPGGADGLSFLAKSNLPDRSKPFTVLGIESSCDDTGAAVVRSDGVILGESLASQSEIHEEFGGIVPGLAKTAHEEKIDAVVNEAITNAGLSSVADVDAIGVTVGPGLEICLRVGCNKGRELAMEFGKPFVGIHHLEAHILMARLPFDDNAEFTVGGQDNVHESKRAIEFPFLALLVSGGHCQLMKCLGIGRYEIIGGTIDDSLGEAFDKTARLLGLPIGGGGGPAVEKLARDGDPKAVQLPIPLQKRKDCDFSYAGLKTAVRMKTEKLTLERELSSVDELSREDKANVAASFQNVAIKHIEERLKRTMDILENEDDGIRSLAVVGGVAANQELRSRLQTICGEREEAWKMFVPPPRLCTDQGSMAAWAAVERIMVGSSDIPDDQEVYARFPFQSINK